jgi:hypothetical protein
MRILGFSTYEMRYSLADVGQSVGNRDLLLLVHAKKTKAETW